MNYESRLDSLGVRQSWEIRTVEAVDKQKARRKRRAFCCSCREA
jgi:hypothetical protein